MLTVLKKLYSNFYTHRHLRQKVDCVWSWNPKNSWGLFSQLNHCWIALCLWVQAVKIGKNCLAFLNHYSYYFVHLYFGYKLHWMGEKSCDNYCGLYRYFWCGGIMLQNFFVANHFMTIYVKKEKVMQISKFLCANTYLINSRILYPIWFIENKCSF